MSNLYADLNTLKSRLGIEGTGEDTDLLALLGAASRAIERWCQRPFYIKEETRYFEGSATPLFFDDLLSIDASGFKLDQDGDGTYGSTLATTDYVLYPLNKYPKTWVRISSDSDYGGFASGIRQGVQIAGKWGYGDGESATPYKDSGVNVPTGDITAAATSMALTSTEGDTFSAGMTLRIEDEQIYVSAVNADTLTLERGVNGTTAASHVATTDIYIYEYPEPIREAVLIQAARLWKRKDSSFQDAVGSPETGELLVYKGLDADVKLIVDAYRRKSI